MNFCKWNVETPYSSPSGDSRPQGSAYGGAGVGYRKKRMPCCNGADTGFNVTCRESGPTSDWWHVARKLREPLVWGKANERCTTGRVRPQHCRKTCTTAVGVYREGRSGSIPSSRVSD